MLEVAALGHSGRMGQKKRHADNGLGEKHTEITIIGDQHKRAPVIGQKIKRCLFRILDRPLPGEWVLFGCRDDKSIPIRKQRHSAPLPALYIKIFHVDAAGTIVVFEQNRGRKQQMRPGSGYSVMRCPFGLSWILKKRPLQEDKYKKLLKATGTRSRSSALISNGISSGSTIDPCINSC